MLNLVPALPSNHNIAFLNIKTRRDMNWNVSMSFLVSVVFFHVVHIISSNDNCSGHFSGNANSPGNVKLVNKRLLD